MFKVALLAFLAVASAAVINDGKCPEIKAVDNFDLKQFTGVWYEIKKVPYPSDKGKCPSAEYVIDGEGFKVKNQHVVDGVQKFIEGTGKMAPNAGKTAEVVISFKFGEVLRESPIKVLATDYKSYAIVYSCKEDETKKSHDSRMWILSREKKMTAEATTAVDNFLKTITKDVDITKLEVSDLSDEACKFSSTQSLTEVKKQ